MRRRRTGRRMSRRYGELLAAWLRVDPRRSSRHRAVGRGATRSYRLHA